MPVYGFPDRKSYDNTARAVRRLNRDLPGSHGEGRTKEVRNHFYMGKPATDFTAGALTAPNNVVNVYKGPAYGGGDEQTGTVEADYAFADVTTTQWVAVTVYRGKRYVTPLECS